MISGMRRLASSEFVQHEPCPKCGSKDNLGVWSDGHKWCFGCQYYIKGDEEQSLEKLKEKCKPRQQQEEKSPDALTLPADFTRALPTVAAAWLMKYGISKPEKLKYHIGWSDKYESLVFAVFDPSDNLCLVQRRYFGQDKFPKYHTKGRPETLVHVLGDADLDTGILVEDFVSGIKVGRRYNAVPLYGSNLSLEKIKRLAHRFSRVILWLDRDKASASVKYKWRAAPFFEKVSIIISEKDPKEYSNEEIASFVEPHL